VSTIYPVQGLFQVAYVTNDLDRAIDNFRDRFAIDRFFMPEREGFLTDEGELVRTRCALCYVGEVMYELIEPGKGKAEAVYGKLSAHRGFHIAHHHMGHYAGSRQAIDQVDRDATRDGLKLMSGPIGTEGRFCYVDTSATTGHLSEYVFIPPSAAGIFADVPRF
jgi:hypothetical protein